MKNPRALLIFPLIGVIAVAALMLPVEKVIAGLQLWAERDATSAMFIVSAAVAAGILLMLPASLMLMLAGFLFGLVKGFMVVWFAGLVASTLAFLIGRTLARPWVERKIQRKAIFMAIDRAISRKGLLVVLLTRLVMVLPYPALNYTLGLTNVSLKDYVLGTNTGMVIPFFLFVYLGTTASNIAAIMSGQISLERNEWIAGLLGLVAVIAIVGLIIRKASAVLTAELAAASSERTTE